VAQGTGRLIKEWSQLIYPSLHFPFSRRESNLQSYSSFPFILSCDETILQYLILTYYQANNYGSVDHSNLGGVEVYIPNIDPPSLFLLFCLLFSPLLNFLHNRQLLNTGTISLFQSICNPSNLINDGFGCSSMIVAGALLVVGIRGCVSLPQ
jgi:hypothetical protein